MILHFLPSLKLCVINACIRFLRFGRKWMMIGTFMGMAVTGSKMVIAMAVNLSTRWCVRALVLRSICSSVTLVQKRVQAYHNSY